MDLTDVLTMPLSQFMETHWGKLPFFSKVHQAERLKSMEEAFGPLEVPKLMQQLFPRQPDVFVRGSSNPYVPVAMPPALALSLYSSKAATLMLDAPAVPTWVEAYLEQIPHAGHPNMLIFASQSGGLGAHFDCQDVLSIQLSGTRKWSLWDPTIWDPGSNHGLTAAPLSRMAYALHGHTYPAQLSAKPTMEFTTEPGTVLYIPRGWWHAAAAGETGEPSLHFTVSPSTRNRLEFVAEAVIAALSRHRAMRTPFTSDVTVDWDMIAQDVTKAIYEIRDAEAEPTFELGVRYTWSRTAYCYVAEANGDKPAALKCGKLNEEGTDEFDAPLNDASKQLLLDWLKRDAFVPEAAEAELAGVLVGAGILVRAGD